MRLFKRISKETTGSQVAEAAAVLPLVFMLLLGIYWFGRAYNIYATITHAAREGVRSAVVYSCATCRPVPDERLTADQVADAVSQALLAAKLDPARVTPLPPAYPSCGGPAVCTLPAGGKAQVCIQYDAQLAITNSVPSCGVAIGFQYPYQFYFPFTSLNLQQISLKAQSQMQGEN